MKFHSSIFFFSTKTELLQESEYGINRLLQSYSCKPTCNAEEIELFDVVWDGKMKTEEGKKLTISTNDTEESDDESTFLINFVSGEVTIVADGLIDETVGGFIEFHLIKDSATRSILLKNFCGRENDYSDDSDDDDFDDISDEE
jgi:hypothetical protein